MEPTGTLSCCPKPGTPDVPKLTVARLRRSEMPYTWILQLCHMSAFLHVWMKWQTFVTVGRSRSMLERAAQAAVPGTGLPRDLEDLRILLEPTPGGFRWCGASRV